MSTTLRLARIALAGVLVFAARADADVIRIASGSLSVDGLSSFSPLVLTGDRGFTLTGRPGLGILDAWDCAFTECYPGDALSIRGFWSGLDLISTVTVDGRHFDNVGAASSDAFASADFQGRVTLPGFADAGVLVRSPFTFEGQFGYFDSAAATQRIFDLVGEGTAAIRLMEGFMPGSWQVEGIEYRFSTDDVVVPEPATILLVGGGLVLAYRRRRNARRPASLPI